MAFKLITILVDDQDEQLEKFLKLIKIASQIGHSFPVVVDPDDSEYKRDFFFDGDGAFKIRDMKIRNLKNE